MLSGVYSKKPEYVALTPDTLVPYHAWATSMLGGAHKQGSALLARKRIIRADTTHSVNGFAHFEWCRTIQALAVQRRSIHAIAGF